jgi:nonribosomal peptide synthetase DhbF
MFSRWEDVAQPSVSSCKVSKTGLRQDKPVSDTLYQPWQTSISHSPEQRRGNVRMTYPSAHGVSDIIALDASMLNQFTVVSLFERQVSLQPCSTALEVNDKSFTYKALDSLANALARQLKKLGIGCNDVVAICLKRTENLLAGILGVLKAGAAYLPLNPDDPPLRLGRIIAHAAARFTVTDNASKTNLPKESLELLLLDDQRFTVAEEDRDHRESLPEPRDLAYVIYTSGTTGEPKGVEVTHGALANVVTDMARRLSFSENGSWLAVTTVSFDIAALELLLPLSYGGKVILASEEQARIGRVLAGIIQRRRPTIMQATPITWRILIESGWTGSSDMAILCGGDRLDRDLADKLLARSASAWNMYGPTETTIWSTADKLSRGEGVVTLGTPLANTEVHILDQEGRLQPAGEIGEICIGGAGLARGYVKDHQLTRRCFIDAQLGGPKSVRLYRTGDLGRWNEHGKLEFYGRIDHQVKINGFRVELAEIERVLQAHPGVAEAAVLGVGGVTNQKRLYAFVVGRDGVEVTSSGLVAHLAQHLPKYMIPERFWQVDGLPITSHGKRDVVALEARTKLAADLPC